ncbi:hypothetical protein BDZ94DRAFT_1308637 [Collybia nuda]|uniref:BRCT domain-containing protein n=1 Tax=Collybia nuda TaxID=64659 RepID=A0A9P5Y6E7_9AGAR|nr:hypothetical protein BDZ94DRAFT_1308637 [Collybia nuda]
MHLFSGVHYYLSSSLSSQRQAELAHVLDNNGGAQVESISSPALTHLVANTNRYEGWQDVAAREEAGELAVVTDKWVDRSMVLGKLQSAAYYSADPAMIFSGVVACATELPTVDLEVLSAGIAALGGQWRTGLTKDVTHLFAISPSSPKYTTALHFQEHTHVKVLLPHWFDDAVRLGLGGLDTTPYEWPDPILLKGPGSIDKNDKEESAKKVATRKLDAEKRVLYKTASLWTPKSPLPPVVLPSSSSSESPRQEIQAKDVWQGRRILLGATLELVGGRKEAVEVGIKRGGGVVVSGKGKEVDSVEECDVFVTRFRSGKAYVKAVRLNKVIGTLPWVFHVQSTGVMSPPMDQLLWYPIPKRVIEGFHLHEITVTNYTGESREYLKKLITAMGATFTPSMSGKNTVLIAAYKSGTKTTKADSWSIPVVNHTWLEDCFIKWRNLTFALEKYISFPEGVDFSTHLGERGVGRAVEEVTEEELEAMEAEEDTESGKGVVEENDTKEDEGDKVAPMGTENSARDAREVQEFISMDGDGDAVMADHGNNHGPVPDGANEMDVDQEDEEAVAKPKTPSQLKSMGSRLREKESMGSAAKTRVKKTKSKKGRSPTPEVQATTRKSGQPGATPTKKTPKKHSDPSTSSDEVEVVSVMRTAEKGKPDGKRNLTRRAGERFDSWITGDDEDGEIQRTSPKKKNMITSDDDMGNKATAQSTLKRRSENDGGLPSVAVKEKAKKTLQRIISDDDTDDAIEFPKPRTKKPSEKSVSSDDDDDMPVKIMPKRGKKKASTKDDENGGAIVAKPKTKPRKKVVSDEEQEVFASTKTRTRGRALPNETDEDHDDEPSTSRGRKPVKALSSAKVKEKAKLLAVSDHEEEEEEEEDISELEFIMQSKSKSKANRETEKARGKVPDHRPKPKPTTPQNKIKSANQHNSETEDEGINDDDPPSMSKKRATAASDSVGKSKSITKPTTGTPQRVLSVLVPPMTLVQLKQSPNKRSKPNDIEMATPSTRLERTESIRAVAGEHGKISAPRPSVVASTASGSKPNASKLKAMNVDAELSMSPPAMEDITFTGRSRRTAATKATQKLREEIMPDVMNYQNEMRNANKTRKSMGTESTGSVYGGRKKRMSGSAMSENEDENRQRDKKRRKVVIDWKDASPESDEEPVMISKATGKGKGKKVEVEESEESDVPKPTKKTNTKGKSTDKLQDDETSEVSKKSSTVRLMTTQVSLSDDVSKTLAKLGVKITTRPSECTHLLAPNLVRTEKFLCALAVAPFILTSKWATDSAAAKKLLDEKHYTLHDEANEKKYNFVLADAIARARESKGGLFAKKTFYVTPKVPIGIQLLKSVVSASGGQTPTLRIINSNPDRHVISCAADSSIWRPIAREHPIYTHELILTAALKQEIDWDSDTFKIPI